MPSLSPEVLRRLAFIRYLVGVGRGQITRPEPLRAVAILTFHDAVELSLHLAGQHLGVQGKPPQVFNDYWNYLAGACRPTREAEMRQLNEMRRGLKHHGILPSAPAIDAAREGVEAFFRENTPRIFGITLDEVSLVDLIRVESAREKLREAERFNAGGQSTRAVAAIAEAVHVVLDAYQDPKGGHSRGSPFYFGPWLGFMSQFQLKQSGLDPKMVRFLEAITESVEAVRDGLGILTLGIDYRRFARFRSLSPSVRRLSNRTSYQIDIPLARGEQGYTPEEVHFCNDFAIEVALALQEFDFEIRDPGAA